MATPANKPGPFGTIVKSVQSLVEGLAVTFTYLWRKPVTIQYPDRMARPIPDTLPERYRGFLEVDIDICTACKACERDCPIGCIGITLEKVDGVRAMQRFDIDLGKCMYCGICVEACPTEAQAPGDTETTRAIRFTREFEGVAPDFASLTFRFVRPGDYVVPFKPKKGEAAATRPRGEIARVARMRAKEYNALAAKWALEHGGAPPKADPVEPIIKEEVVLERARELLALVDPVRDEPEKIADLLYQHALAQTDCEECGYRTCVEYADAIVGGREKNRTACDPGGPQATRDETLILELRAGKTAEEAGRLAIEAVKRKHG